MNTITGSRGTFNQHPFLCNIHNVWKFSKVFCFHNSPLKTLNNSYLVQINIFSLSQQNKKCFVVKKCLECQHFFNVMKVKKPWLFHFLLRFQISVSRTTLFSNRFSLNSWPCQALDSALSTEALAKFFSSCQLKVLLCFLPLVCEMQLVLSSLQDKKGDKRIFKSAFCYFHTGLAWKLYFPFFFSF